jgi:hypothetical protein
VRPNNTLKFLGRLIGFIFLIAAPPTLQAATFIGNGGSAQDIDLDAALAIINDGSRNVSTDSKTLCTCSEGWVDNDLCRVLSQLSDEERKACRDLLVKHAPELGELSKRDSKLRFEWADSPMSVRILNNSTRKVDAVSQVEKETIIVNRQRFFEMPLMFRTALITHELFHFVKINGEHTDDEKPAPPFKSGRSMLDTLGAALTMESFERQSFDEIRDLESVSRSKRRNWVYVDFQGTNHPSTPSKRLLKKSNSGGSSFTYAWRPNELGFHIGLTSDTYEGSYRSKITVKEDISLLGLGINYRINPVRYYLSKWNETHLTVGLTALTGDSEYEASSAGVAKKDQAKVLGGSGGIRALMALNNGFWLSIGAELRHIRYEYKKLNIKTIENQSVFTLGGAYGF